LTGNFRFPRRIKNFSYEPETEVLSITFHTGNTQEYCNVPDIVYQNLESSPDQNEYYDANIYGNYQLCQSKGSNDNYGIRLKIFHR